jgi:hypothetical protein
VTITSLTADKTFPLGAGTTVTWTTGASGGVGPLQYQYSAQLQSTGVWTVVRAYAPAATGAWVVPQQGTFTVRVEVRRAGSTGAAEATASVANLTANTSAPSIPFFTADRPFPIPPGTTVNWTAVAGGTGPLEYAYWTQLNGGTWVLAQAYSLSQTFAWTPSTAGTYAVDVGVRPVGNANGWLARKSVTGRVVGTGPIGSVGLTVSQSLPVSVGTPMTWTATASGGTAPLEYQYWRLDWQSETWSLVRDFSPNPTWAWTAEASAFGQYTLHVRVRATGSAAAYEALGVSGVWVTP